jgi:hypothetical protein
VQNFDHEFFDGRWYRSLPAIRNKTMVDRL